MDPRQRLAQLLGAQHGRGSFSARRTATPDDLHIDVTGVGALTMPVSAAKARQLISVARPAQYGQGEQTLTDATVRHTWQVPKSRVRIDKRRWNRTLIPILEGLRGDLGLPEGSRLHAELHSFLVYSPGQFFLPHQDSEKSDDMVGTLTVTLPGASRGGELIVQHGEKFATYRSSDKLLSFVAFYADCRHEVQPVTSGFRIVLTYNLLLAVAGETAPTLEPDETAELAACLEAHFAEQNRLVYLLDHQYTARGMSWTHLKGVDAQRVRALDVAARASGCEVALALAEVHESWSASEPEEPYGRRYDEDQEDDEPDDPEMYELDELLDSSVSLSDWIDRSGAPAPPVATFVSADEVSATTPTRALAPYESEYEGYMGNYGNTMDRWYRRGAVVVWPTRLDFEVRAEASPQWALDTLQALIGDGELTRAREQAESLSSFWMGLRSADSVGELAGRKPDLGQVLAVASGIDDANLAAMLLAPFRLGELAPPNAALLSALAQRHGEGWTRTLLAGWNSLPGWHYAPVLPAGWLAALPDLCGALRDADGLLVARLVLGVAWDRLADSLRQARAMTQPSRRALVLDQLTGPIAGLLVGAATCEAPEILDAAVAGLNVTDHAMLRCLVAVVRALPRQQSEVRAGTRFDALAQEALSRLESEVTRPHRDPDDWSIEPPPGCNCPLCATLNDFLAEPGRRAVDWPLKEQGRRHIHGRIDAHELPVRHVTRRVGRPYTLQLSKTQLLFEREKQERQADEDDLKWLRAVVR